MSTVIHSFHVIAPEINPAKLALQIVQLGLTPVSYERPNNGSVVLLEFPAPLSLQKTNEVQALLASHNPIDLDQQKRENAIVQAGNIPNWSSWNEAEALAFFDANVTTAAAALPVIRALIRMVIALRNDAWPGLED